MNEGRVLEVVLGIAISANCTSLGKGGGGYNLADAATSSVWQLRIRVIIGLAPQWAPRPRPRAPPHNDLPRTPRPPGSRPAPFPTFCPSTVPTLPGSSHTFTGPRGGRSTGPRSAGTWRGLCLPLPPRRHGGASSAAPLLCSQMMVNATATATATVTARARARARGSWTPRAVP